jgi:hypothetical protein
MTKNTRFVSDKTYLIGDRLVLGGRIWRVIGVEPIPDGMGYPFLYFAEEVR